jgi:hypothetical protein
LDKNYVNKRKRDKNNKEKLKKDEDDYNKEKLRLQVQAQAELLREDIRFAKAEIAIAEAVAQASGKQADIDKVASAKEKLAALETSLDALITDFHLKNNKTREESDAELTAKRLEQLDKIKEYAQQAFDVIGGFIAANSEKQKNAAQDEIDALEAKRQKDIEVANQTIANEQDKAAAIAVINARADAQKKQLELKQRQADEQKARFNKAASIVEIILNTSVAVTKFLAKGDVFEAIAAGIIGAAQLAVAIATPIPKYATGGQHEGGPMIVGDGGKSEAIVLPDGSIIKSPATATLMDAPAGTVIYPDFNKMLLNASMTKPPEFTVKTSSTEGTERAIKQMGKDVVRAIKNQPQTTIKGLPRWKTMTQTGSSFKTYLDNTL